VRTDLPGDVRAPAAARAFVLGALGDPGLPLGLPTPHDVVLVVSELVTNSVHAGATAIAVELTATEDRLELSVIDDAGGWPATRQATWDDTHGRGLAIIEDVADEWHSTVLDRGKRVTATWSRLASRPGG
jgi:anti-sigma regulatory factor (Ser/Thr protein kinase)